MSPKLIVEQKITAFTNQYRVYTTSSEGTKATIVAFAQQKRLAFKEKVTFYKDEAKTQIVFTFRAEKVLDVHGRYFVEDPDGQVIGSFKKDFTKSLLNSTWHILGLDNQVKITISESNQVLAIMRRLVGFVPIIGGLLELAALLFRYHFVFTRAHDNQLIGRYQKTTLLRDHYALSMTDEAFAAEDWRVLASMAVALDALQSR
jgi:uncharacterized protein YxjI